MNTTCHCFCGIDVGKNKHVAAAIDSSGRFRLRSQSFRNDAPGFQLVLTRLAELGGPDGVLVGLEATGHYWYAVHDTLRRSGYDCVVVNPLQTAQQAKKAIRKTKTDRVDAGHIATLIKNGDYRPALVPDDFAMTCRQTTRLLNALRKQRAQVKQLIRSRLVPVWPEYESYFADTFCATSRALLAVACTPRDFLSLEHDRLTDLVRRTSRGRLGADLVQRATQSARQSVGMQRGLDGPRIGIPILLEQLSALKAVRSKLEQRIDELAQSLPAYLFTLPGASNALVVSLFGETDPITRIDGPDQLVAFAGLDLTVYQTGQFDPQRRFKITKRGSPHLRRTLWTMARTAAFQEGHLRALYLRKRSQGLHHLAAVTALAVKLCRISWVIMTERRDFIPDGPPSPA